MLLASSALACPGLAALVSFWRFPEVSCAGRRRLGPSPPRLRASLPEKRPSLLSDSPKSQGPPTELGRLALGLTGLALPCLPAAVGRGHTFPIQQNLWPKKKCKCCHSPADLPSAKPAACLLLDLPTRLLACGSGQLEPVLPAMPARPPFPGLSKN